ncbi:uncharacterized protein LOC135132255 [Zophobas morio]|uniref:uncharacterized protein LOC135132255 n=1 Tax=Zophobas morio TaxID=2755281 RepID=UPI0030838F7F
MKLAVVIIIGVFTVTSAIRVPTSWKKNGQTHARFRTGEIAPNVQTHERVNRNEEARHHNLKKPEVKKEFRASATLGEWKPVFPSFHGFLPAPTFPGYRKQQKPAKTSPLYKNYRDDVTHEPSGTDEHVGYEKPKPISVHEVPLDVPTRPIYPGEGQWAKKGKKHRPFISKHVFTPPEREENEEKPDGYETFEKNKQLFERHRQKFGHAKDDDNEEDEEDEYDDDDEKQEFVPTKLYTQVRRSESEQHLPTLVEDPRLREVIKDSKIQTVYTEEGYEDLAYDHAGHEKTAEEDEGYAEFDKEIESEKTKSGKTGDSEAQGSHHHVVKKPKMKKNKLMKSEESKTLSVKKDDKNTELEVSSQVKVLHTPNNETKTHKFVKIFPKVYRYDKVTPETTDGIAKTQSAINHNKRRQKRYTNDFPKIVVDTDFIDKINHRLPQIEQVVTKPKYPYYNDPTINPYSPLRYAEDLDNIPKKTQDELAFYHQADKIRCAEVQTDVDPIPHRVKNADKDPENVEDATDVQELVQMPRLMNLGDKIDCFKIKFFGEDPLDSPIFKEEIGPVLPIFKVFKKVNTDPDVNETREKKKYSAKIPQPVDDKSGLRDHELTILADVINQFNKSRESRETEVTTVRPEVTENQTEVSVISIITTPKYTIDLKPKHIYHQIELLEYLPQYSKIDNSTDNDAPIVDRMGKSLDEPTTTSAPIEESPPESQALKHRRRPRPRRPYYQVFDVNQYLPRNTYSLLNRVIRTSTVLPRGGTDYKKDIKASEQLNVFADVINNIKSSGKNPYQVGASSNRVSVKTNLLDNYRKIPVFEAVDDIEESAYSTTVAPRGTIKYSSYKNKEQLFENMANRDKTKYENLELLKIKKRLTTTTEPYASDTRVSSSVEDEDDDEEEEDDDEESVVGLVPPVPNKYTTIFTKPLSKETRMNLFYVLGMKPPSPKQKVYVYSDFKRPLKSKYRRSKRSAVRPAYSEVVRNRNKPIDVDDVTEAVIEEDDDYVPHRPKNYHYDEKTGRIVYDKTEKETEAPDEEYIEVTEAPIPKPTRRNSVTTVKFEEFTGPSYVEFIKKLKSNPNYQEITDPPPTEKGEEVTTTSTTTTKPVSTDPPEFLSFLAKVRSDSSYKAIPDKTTSKTTTTTEAAEVVEDEEETQLENVQNSPGGQSSGQGFQIFDINDYLPKVKNYTPTTSIDYSKYKTIERTHVPLRHNLSSRYNSDEEDPEDVRTSRVPVILEDKDDTKDDNLEINPVMSESKREEVEPSTTTSTTTTTTEPPPSTRRRTRPKSRGTRRPTTATTSSSTEDNNPAVHSKTKRVFPRRRPSRIKLNRATTEAPDSEIEESASAKVVRRRHQKSDNLTTKAEVPEDTKTNQTQNATLKKDGDVQVFQKYDQKKRHGGAYTKELEEKRLTDVVAKPSSYFTDPKLPKKINQLVEGKGGGVEEEVTGSDETEEEYDYEGSEEKAATTKKPVFVKDPAKRLYYYAPI